MVNSKKGEVAVTICEAPHVFRLDLNGLNELAERFGFESLEEMDVLAKELLKPKHLRFAVATALRGGSIPDCTEELAGTMVSMADLKPVIEGVTAALAIASQNIKSAASGVADQDPPSTEK